MTVVYVPQPPHSCDLPLGDDKPGTVRRCDCGRFWVWQARAESRADEYSHRDFPCWRPEKRRERRQRERAHREARMAPPPSVKGPMQALPTAASLRRAGRTPGQDVHVDWHMTQAEWDELRGILLRNTGYEYIGRLEAAGKLDGPPQRVAREKGQ